jgi:hypothetical protein
MFQAGAAEVDITPPMGLAMDGYLARSGRNTGAHDPLLAQALVMKTGDKQAAIVTLDVLAVSAAFTDPLRQSLATMLHTSVDAVMICASHTHCGPAGLHTWFGEPSTLGTQLTRMIHERVTEAAQIALRHLSPAGMVYAVGDVEGIGGDRNFKERQVDSQVTVLRFDKPDGTPIAILFHYACHPTVLGADTRLYSAEFPGAARNQIKAAYPDAIPLFLNGAAGNVSTRFFRSDQSFKEMERLGSLLGNRVVTLLEQPTSSTSTNLGWNYRNIELPLRAFAEQESRSFPPTGETRIDRTRAEGVMIERQLQQKFAGRSSQTASLSVLRIGDWKLAFVPGEAFSDLAIALREPAPLALVVGYANDYLGYFPTQVAIDGQTYEALSSPYDARAHHLIETTLTEQLLRLAPNG